MIKGVTEVLSGVHIYHGEYEGQQLVQELKQEASRDWSYLPFYLANGSLDYCKSFFCPVGHILNISPAENSLKEIKTGVSEVNKILEKFLYDYSHYYSSFFKRDGGLNFFRFVGNNFSSHLKAPSTAFCTSAFLSFSHARMRLARHDVEFDVSPGDGIIMPSGFPFEVNIKPTEEEAFFFTKYMWPK